MSVNKETVTERVKQAAVRLTNIAKKIENSNLQDASPTDDEVDILAEQIESLETVLENSLAEEEEEDQDGDEEEVEE